MRAKFLAVSLIVGALATPALANKPTERHSTAAPGYLLRFAPSQDARDAQDAPMPFMERERGRATGTRPLTGQHGNGLAPPHMDAGGVPSPRV